MTGVPASQDMIIFCGSVGSQRGPPERFRAQILGFCVSVLLLISGVLVCQEARAIPFTDSEPEARRSKFCNGMESYCEAGLVHPLRNPTVTRDP